MGLALARSEALHERAEWREAFPRTQYRGRRLSGEGAKSLRHRHRYAEHRLRPITKVRDAQPDDEGEPVSRRERREPDDLACIWIYAGRRADQNRRRQRRPDAHLRAAAEIITWRYWDATKYPGRAVTSPRTLFSVTFTSCQPSR